MPQYAVISDGKEADISAARKMSFAPGTMLVFDRGYADYDWWLSLTHQKVFFVTRLKDKADYQVVEKRAAPEYDAVDPSHRLVASELERRWNEKLERVAQLERAYAQAERDAEWNLTADERAAIAELSQDLPAIWSAETTTNQERKQLLRMAIESVLHNEETSTHRPFEEGYIDFRLLAPQLLEAPVEWWCIDLCFWPGSWELIEPSREFVLALLSTKAAA